jgi:hypothetical protein
VCHQSCIAPRETKPPRGWQRRPAHPSRHPLSPWFDDTKRERAFPPTPRDTPPQPPPLARQNLRGPYCGDGALPRASPLSAPAPPNWFASASPPRISGHKRSESALPPPPAGDCAKSAAGDTNANALDSGLDALIAFLGVADEDYATRCAPSHPSLTQPSRQPRLHIHENPSRESFPEYPPSPEPPNSSNHRDVPGRGPASPASAPAAPPCTHTLSALPRLPAAARRVSCPTWCPRG